jgi:dTDP-4-amino-4,6-dideoxygalactose transaminase
MLADKYVVSSERFLQPSYRISPFMTRDVSKNKRLNTSSDIDDYFQNRFNSKNYIYTASGRSAINQALSKLRLKRDDVVTIFTTSGNYYISGCVTTEIEKYCKWSRIMENNTKVILVNHEFGFPYEKLSELKKYDLPIIEDCAHSFVSQNHEKTVGTIGSYVIYSLPKFFPIQIGGLLVSNIENELNGNISEEEEEYIKNVLSNYVANINEIIKKRIENYRYLESKLGELGFTARFELCDDLHCPGVYLFRINKDIDINKVKIFFQSHGIECSVFYNETSFFLPVHQRLTFDDLDYFVILIKYFVENNIEETEYGVEENGANIITPLYMEKVIV